MLATNPIFGIKNVRWTMLTRLLSRFIRKTESMIMRSFLGSFMWYMIWVGSAIRMVSETTAAARDVVNPDSATSRKIRNYL